MQLKRKRDRSDKPRRQGALFKDAGEQEAVFKKKSKRSKEDKESKLGGMGGELELNTMDSGEDTQNEHNLDLHRSKNGQALDSRRTRNEQPMNPECRKIGRSESSKEGQTTNEKKSDYKNSSKRNREGTERKLKGMTGEHELSTMDGREGTRNEHNLDLYCSRKEQAFDSRSTMDERCMNPEYREVGRSERSKEGQTGNGQKSDYKKKSKPNKEGTESKLEGTIGLKSDYKKKSKRNKEGTESKVVGMKGEHEVNTMNTREGIQKEHNLDLYRSRNGQALDFRSTMVEQQSECREVWRSESSKEGQMTNGQKSESHRDKKKQKSISERSVKGKQSHSDSIKKEDKFKYDCNIEAQEMHDAKENKGEMLNMSKDIKENKMKKNRKKRDRWGQVLNDAGNTKDSVDEDGDAVFPDNVGEPEDAAFENGIETLTKHDGYKGEYDRTTVCAGGMPYDTKEEDILSFFKECGPVARVTCLRFADTQRFNGLSFITFETETAASKALSLDGANMGDRLIKVEKARAGGKVVRAPPKREAGSMSVYVGNLDWNVRKIDIKRFFKGCRIDDVRLTVDKNTGDFRGYGHVDFSDEESLEKAVTMNQKQLLGRPIKVSYAVAKGWKGNPS